MCPGFIDGFPLRLARDKFGCRVLQRVLEACVFIALKYEGLLRVYSGIFGTDI